MVLSLLTKSLVGSSWFGGGPWLLAEEIVLDLIEDEVGGARRQLLQEVAGEGQGPGIDLDLHQARLNRHGHVCLGVGHHVVAAVVVLVVVVYRLDLPRRAHGNRPVQRMWTGGTRAQNFRLLGVTWMGVRSLAPVPSVFRSVFCMNVAPASVRSMFTAATLLPTGENLAGCHADADTDSAALRGRGWRRSRRGPCRACRV